MRTAAYGGIVINEKGLILLRRPRGDFDGYVWTFPKGRTELGESAEDAALREVREETGYCVEIIASLPGSFRGGSTVTEYFLMSPTGEAGPFDGETLEIRWVSLNEAFELIGLTKNNVGKARDLSVLDVVRGILKDMDLSSE